MDLTGGQMAGATATGATEGVVARLRPWAGHVGRLALGLVFLAAGFLKALDPAEFARQIAGFGLVGPGLARLGAPLLIALEIGLGTALVAAFRPRAALTTATLLLVAFIGIEAYAMAHGKTEACGCFGAYVERTPTEVILEDLLFIGLASLGLWGLRSRDGWRRPLPGFSVAALTVLGLGFAVASPSLPIDPLVTRLAVGRTLGDLGLAAKVPGLDVGRHLVALLDVTEPSAVDLGARLNQLAGSLGGPTIVALTPATEEEVAAFLWSAIPAFDVRSVDRPVLKRLYRQLPWFFIVDQGKVVAIFGATLPPPSGLSLLSSEAS